MRSTWGKLDNVIKDMDERETPVTFLTELWEKKCSVKHQKRIEKVSELNGIGYMSCPRQGRRRGGGCGLIFKKDKISITKAPVEVPRNLEVFWAVMRVLNQGKNPLKLIICCFYSPPNSKQKTSLINHIQIEYSKLKKSLPTAGTVILGDKND